MYRLIQIKRGASMPKKTKRKKCYIKETLKIMPGEDKAPFYNCLIMFIEERLIPG